MPMPKVGPNEVLLRVRAAGVGLTVVIMTANPGRVTSFPRIPGHEVAGGEVGDLIDERREVVLVHGERGVDVPADKAETILKSDAHFWATLNYVHQNPVRHGLAKRWQEWSYSSARKYLEEVGREEAERIWRAYPVGRYGDGWDE